MLAKPAPYHVSHFIGPFRWVEFHAPAASGLLDGFDAPLSVITVDPELRTRMAHRILETVRRFPALSAGNQDRHLQDVLVVVEEGLAHGTVVQDREVVLRAREAVVEAIRLVSEGRARTVNDLLGLIPLSRPSLYRAFEVTLGVTPSTWMRMRRLHELRRTLLNGDPVEMTVGAASTSAGFVHAGHLAATYRRVFGELPSDTLNRSRTI